MDDEMVVVWHGALVDSYGTKGGFNIYQPSRSTWHLVEQALWSGLGSGVREIDGLYTDNQTATELARIARLAMVRNWL